MDRKPKQAGFTLIELLIVLGIFTITVGASLSVFLTGKLSFDVSEANIQAEYQARLAMNRIADEVRLSRAGLIRVSDNINWTDSNLSGSVISFQIPVGSYNDQLDVDLTDYSLKWGSDTAKDEYLAYSVNANQQLVRSVYTLTDGSDAVSTVVVPGISSISFDRSSVGSELINLTITADTQTASGYATSRTLESSIKLRN